MSEPSTRLPTPEGPGSVSGAPHLPPGFTGTFTSRYVDTGELRLHGGHRRPRSAAAAGPRLARDLVRLAAADAGALAGDLVALMEALGHQRFAVVGHDTGMNAAPALRR